MSSYSESNMVELAGKILIVSIVIVSVVVVFVFFVHLYAKWFWYRREENRDVDGSTTTTRRRRRRGDFTAGHQEPGVTVLRRGLDASFLKTIPVIVFDPKDFKDGLECTVCLSELVEGEKTRVLPKCNHGFHVECIDMWFHSHSTCPICRNPVSDQTEVSVENLLESRQTQEQSRDSVDSQEFPTNILFWGDETEVITLTSQLEEANSHHHQSAVLTCETSSSSSSSQINRPDLVIDIPRLIDENDDQKTPVSSSRMRSLRRILSGSRRFINPFSPANSNIEQGTITHR